MAAVKPGEPVARAVRVP